MSCFYQIDRKQLRNAALTYYIYRTRIILLIELLIFFVCLYAVLASVFFDRGISHDGFTFFYLFGLFLLLRLVMIFHCTRIILKYFDKRTKGKPSDLRIDFFDIIIIHKSSTNDFAIFEYDHLSFVLETKKYLTLVFDSNRIQPIPKICLTGEQLAEIKMKLKEKEVIIKSKRFIVA